MRPGMLYCQRVAELLAGRGVETFSGLHVKGGTDWHVFLEKLNGRFAQCEVLVAVVTPALFLSKPCLEEIYNALEAKIWILPILFEGPIPPVKQQWPMITMRDSEKNKLMLQKVTKEFSALNTIPAPPGNVLQQPEALAQAVVDVVTHLGGSLQDPGAEAEDSGPGIVHTTGYSMGEEAEAEDPSLQEDPKVAAAAAAAAAATEAVDAASARASAAVLAAKTAKVAAHEAAQHLQSASLEAAGLIQEAEQHEAAMQAIDTGSLADEPSTELEPEAEAEVESESPQVWRATLAQLESVSAAEASEGKAGYYSKENWLPDDATAACMNLDCSSGSGPGRPLQFNLFKRRHHCRRCGQIFCGDCSSGRVVLIDSGEDKAHRVCAPCVASLAEIVARERAE
eukprot:SAG22_NODE_3765_length_1538_cov_1.253648_1_plen_396_part_01